MTYLFAGASSAIATSCAQHLREKGHRVIGLSTKELSFPYDLRYQVQTYQAAELPPLDESLDGLVYFPGSINLKPFARLTRAEFLQDFERNVLGAVELIQTYLPPLKKSPHPSVVLLSSVAAQVGMPFHSSISIAKAGIEGLTRSLAAELAPTVRVNCVAPSLTRSPLSERFLNTPEKESASQNRNPLKKIGEPAEVAAVIEFLLSEQALWITGQCLGVDGGMNHLRI